METLLALPLEPWCRPWVFFVGVSSTYAKVYTTLFFVFQQSRPLNYCFSSPFPFSPSQDLADVVVRLVELANSREATTMAAEFTVNVEHALEMEHMAGIARRTAAANAAAGGGADADVGSIAGDAFPVSAGHGGVDGGADDDGVVAVGVPGNDSQGSAEGEAEAKEEEEEEERTLDDLVREARLERARQEGGGGGNSIEGAGSAGHRRSDSACSSLRGGSGSRPSTDDRTSERLGERAGFDHSSCPGNTTPIIRQADLAGDRPLSSFRRGAGTAPVSPTSPTSDATVTTGGNTTTDTSRSAPSSPRGRYPSSAAAAASALTAFGRSLPQGGPSRGRASTITGAGFGAGGGTGAGSNSTAAGPSSSSGARLAAGPRRGGGNCGESDGAESVASAAARPAARAVEYERDGNARLPRFKSEHIASVLRGQPLGLELQLEAPNEDSLDDTVARASRVSLEGASPRSPRAEGASGSALGAAAQHGAEPGTTGGSPGEEEGRGATEGPCGAAGRSAAARPKPGGWKQVVFACLLLLFAADGLRHRWKSLFRSERDATREGPSGPPPPSRSSAAPLRVPFGRETAGGVDGVGSGRGGSGGGDEGSASMFVLPSSCEDHTSGRAMEVWVTPSGPCVWPASISGDEAGGGGSRCAPSFRLCGAAEVVVQDSSDVTNDGRREREEL